MLFCHIEKTQTYLFKLEGFFERLQCASPVVWKKDVMCVWKPSVQALIRYKKKTGKDEAIKMS